MTMTTKPANATSASQLTTPAPRVLITGGCGFIGKFATNEMLSAGFAVEIVDNLSAGTCSSIPATVPIHRFDVLDEASLKKILRTGEIDLVVHLAGPHSVPQSKLDPHGYFHHIVDPTQALIGAASQSSVKGIIFASTSRVYGNYPHLAKLAEDVTCHPIDPYGAAKLYSEDLLLKNSTQFKVANLRFFNVAGAHPNGKIGRTGLSTPHLIKVLCNIALGKNEHFRLHAQGLPTEDGSSVRDFIHVVDVARAIRMAAEHLLQKPENLTLNIGSGLGTSIYEMIRLAERVFKTHIPVVLDASIREDVPTLIADIGSAKSVLGWEPTFSARDILEHAWAWEKSQKTNADEKRDDNRDQNRDQKHERQKPAPPAPVVGF
jgi:UDP-glucose 4-epimerase